MRPLQLANSLPPTHWNHIFFLFLSFSKHFAHATNQTSRHTGHFTTRRCILENILKTKFCWANNKGGLHQNLEIIWPNFAKISFSTKDFKISCEPSINSKDMRANFILINNFSKFKKKKKKKSAFQLYWHYWIFIGISLHFSGTFLCTAAVLDMKTKNNDDLLKLVSKEL